MIQAIDTYFPEIREAYEKKSAQSLGQDQTFEGPSFTQMLQQSISQLNADFEQADATVNDFLAGKKEIQDVLIDLQKVNMEFRLAVQVRNKLVESYQEIMRMSI